MARGASSAPRRSGALSVLAVLAGCAAAVPRSETTTAPTAASATASASAAPRPPAVAKRPPENAAFAQRYREHLAQLKDLDFAGLVAKSGARRAGEPQLGFDPTTARYWDRVSRALGLSAQERDIFARTGFVSSDHGRRYSMGSAYYAIYTRDLPVLITSDSILHALHRSYDEVLKNMEKTVFVRTIDDALRGSHDELEKAYGSAKSPALRTSLGDVDLYVTVARNLLAGAGVAADSPPTPFGPETWDGKLAVPSRTGQDAAVLALLRAIATQQVGVTTLWGGTRDVDYSQFQPRGHYEDDLELRRYFRTLMWLGRVDLGFHLRAPDPQSKRQIDFERERRAALVFGSVLTRADGIERLAAMSAIIDFMIGASDNVTLGALASALRSSKATDPAALADDAIVNRVVAKLAGQASGGQLIRSQVLKSDPENPRRTELPLVFQVFGQRFLLDSFVLSEVVYDSITFQGMKQLRTMPSGLDVMAALGNDEALFTLEPDLTRFRYSANALALRRVVAERTPEAWDATLYDGWLDALRRLDDVPAGHLPRAMRSRAWQHKQLQTQLASWAELRHDTLLYGKQSYTATLGCEYPEGFVEPYPEFFERMGMLARRAARLLGAAHVSAKDTHVAAAMAAERTGQVRFFEGFAEVMQQLETLARKELRAEPFTASEEQFLKQTIDIRGGGSGPPRYGGWYPRLIYGGSPAQHKPTVADVHTSPPSEIDPGGRVLEAAVGDAQFLAIAVDNEDDRAVYVGPVYSYYEFTTPLPKRLTDREWAARLEKGDLPPRPALVRTFTAARQKRDLPPPAAH